MVDAGNPLEREYELFDETVNFITPPALLLIVALLRVTEPVSKFITPELLTTRLMVRPMEIPFGTLKVADGSMMIDPAPENDPPV